MNGGDRHSHETRYPWYRRTALIVVLLCCSNIFMTFPLF